MNSSKFKFTLARLKALPATGKRYEVSDTQIPGLVCRVSADGTRSLFIFKRPRGETTKVRVKLRSTGNMVGMRLEANQIVADLAGGINPNIKAKEDSLLAITLADAFAQYIKAKNPSKNTVSSYQKAMERMARWADKPVKSITREQVLSLYGEIAKDSESSAMKVGQVLSAVWNFQNDLTDDDAFGRCPTVILNRQKKGWNRIEPRNRDIPEDILPDWIQAVRGLDSRRMGLYLEFLLLTGLRRREAGHLRWNDVNQKDNYYIVRHTKNGSDHCLPMTIRTKEIIREMIGINSEEVFGVEEPRKAIKQVIKLTDITFSSHDLRRTYIKLADSSGVGSYVLKALVNHADSSDVTFTHYANLKAIDSTGNVNRTAINKLRDAAQQIEDYILSKAKIKTNVLELVQ